MFKNTSATNKICKLLQEQSRLIKQFEHDMQRVIQDMMFESSVNEEPLHEDLIKEGIQKALAKNAINVQNLYIPKLVIQVNSNENSLETRTTNELDNGTTVSH